MYYVLVLLHGPLREKRHVHGMSLFVFFCVVYIDHASYSVVVGVVFSLSSMDRAYRLTNEKNVYCLVRVFCVDSIAV